MQCVLDLQHRLARTDRRGDAAAPAIEVDDVLLAADHERPRAHANGARVDLTRLAVDRHPELAIGQRPLDDDTAIAPRFGDNQLALHDAFLICYPRACVPSLLDVLLERRIIVCVGSGGVGKTTTAAALALAAARRGKKTLVLTIDPAKRLANSLGLAALGHRVQEVDRNLVRAG